MNKKRYTSITRTRYRELILGMASGELKKKWDGIGEKSADELTKKQRVEERQILAIALIVNKSNQESQDILLSDDWSKLHILVNEDTGLYSLEIEG